MIIIKMFKRSFSTALKSHQQMIETQYMVNMARVCVRMPSVGDMWFFVDKQMKVAQFKNMCKQEDTQISKVEVLHQDKTLNEEDSLFNLLNSRNPLFLTLNDITYKFDTEDITADDKQINI